jgi:hypothetical protein
MYCTVFVVLTVVLTSCVGIGQAPPTSVPDVEYTLAAETIAAELTQKAHLVTPAQISAPTTLAQGLPTATSTLEALPPTSTEEPTETLPPTSTPLPTDTPLPSDTPTLASTSTSTATPEPEWVTVIEEDMKSGFWSTDKTDAFRLQYTMGGYLMTSNVVNDVVFSVRDKVFGDVRLDVTGTYVSGPLDGYYGLICNFANGGNFYILAVGVDGWYGIGLKHAGQIKFLQEGIDQSGSVRTGDVSNQLRAECAQGTLTLWANGVQLATVKDLTLTQGKVGLGVGNRKTTGIEVLFQDFKVYTPAQP